MQRWIAAMAAACFSLSCIAVRENNLIPVEIKKHAGEKIQVFSSWSIESTSLSEDQRESIAERYRSHFEDALDRNGCCEAVESKGEADVVLLAKSPMESRITALLAALLSGATLFIIPSWATEEINITGSVNFGGKTQTHAWRDSITLIQWLPLAFTMPFNASALDAGDKLAERVFDHIAADVQQDYKQSH